MTHSSNASLNTTQGASERYVLSVLMVIYTLNLLDRQIVNILAEPIKQDLQLSDWQIGVMSGLAFALFYSLLGIPLARWADRPTSNRSLLISAALAVWSGMTALCGLATNFISLLAARIGVGVGEAGCSPAAHSLISDLVPQERRATALAFFSLGIPIGKLLGMILGGAIAQVLGWREAFIIVGLPGLAVAALTVFTVKDPRMVSPVARQGAAPPQAPLSEALRASPAFWYTTIACSFCSFLSFGQTAFFGSLFIRVHGWSVGEAGLFLGLALGAAGIVGTWLGGRASDRAARRTPSALVLIPGTCCFLGAILVAAGALTSNAELALLLIAVGIGLNSTWYGPCFALIQALNPPERRATASAINLTMVNLIGLGTGPVLFGIASDLFNNGFQTPLGALEGMGPERGLVMALALGPVFGALLLYLFLKAAKHVTTELGASQSRTQP